MHSPEYIARWNRRFVLYIEEGLRNIIQEILFKKYYYLRNIIQFVKYILRMLFLLNIVNYK